ncbi:DUF1559 domain-containing protein [Neorhodopirellula pilleata]|uniref:DUF1559 domain-containing protein n=1 Tax=Neorhodopirellula pilleata TaxID=2714738 RepID=A0A5C6AVK8_9BACT|nr:DUF1559 domain-containing protein [Neorhodopirellula pilleata]TWU03517.1 hypothetical protein Pla100_04440 [Neorhodopirellula pilleata]
MRTSNFSEGLFRGKINFEVIGNRLKCSLALHNYHAAYNQCPRSLGGSGNPVTTDAQTLLVGTGNNRNDLSWLVGLTPFMEQQAIWEQISNPLTVAAGTFQAMGPNPKMDQSDHAVNRYEPWYTELAALRCPSDPGVGLPAKGRTNYAYCAGDSIHMGDWGALDNNEVVDNTRAIAVRHGQRGFFVPRQDIGFRDILDGLSNTIAAGEIVTDLGDRDKRTQFGIAPGGSTNDDGRDSVAAGGAIACNGTDPSRPQFWGTQTTIINAEHRRGYCWAWGRIGYCGINTILPPNKEFCMATSSRGAAGIAPPGSRHQGGCHVLMGDGAVKFITDSIEAGDSGSAQVSNAVGGLAAGRVSPFGLWGSLGTRGARETIDTSF